MNHLCLTPLSSSCNRHEFYCFYVSSAHVYHFDYIPSAVSRASIFLSIICLQRRHSLPHLTCSAVLCSVKNGRASRSCAVSVMQLDWNAELQSITSAQRMAVFRGERMRICDLIKQRTNRLVRLCEVRQQQWVRTGMGVGGGGEAVLGHLTVPLAALR